MSALGYMPTDVYRIVLHGDDLNHLSRLVADDRGLEENCDRCERIRRAVALAEYHEIPDRAA